jgi:hypothetical protein
MFYIGSTSLLKIEKGYKGSVSSKEYKSIWKSELKNNPHLFKIKIISKHASRKEATEKENTFHKKLSVVVSPMYINKSNAIPDGVFGVSSQGMNNPMYGKTREDARLRMLENNPMRDPKVAEKVTNKKRELRQKGLHKSTKNGPESLKRLSQRLKDNNPNQIRCSCINCKKQTTLSGLSRFHRYCQ